MILEDQCRPYIISPLGRHQTPVISERHGFAAVYLDCSDQCRVSKVRQVLQNAAVTINIDITGITAGLAITIM